MPIIVFFILFNIIVGHHSKDVVTTLDFLTFIHLQHAVSKRPNLGIKSMRILFVNLEDIIFGKW